VSFQTGERPLGLAKISAQEQQHRQTFGNCVSRFSMKNAARAGGIGVKINRSVSLVFVRISPA
jgi:hypothetical protein